MAEFKKAKNIFNKLKSDPYSVAFPEEILDKKLLARLKKSKYVEDKNFFKLVNLLENNNVIFDVDNVNRTDYVKKRETDRSIHADVGNLEFLGKNATFPRYVLVVVDLFSSKVTLTLRNLENKLDKGLNSFMMMLKIKEKGKK